MKENRRLNINGTMLEKSQLDKYLEKIAASHNICTKSDKTTYPIPGLLEDFEFIKEVYDLLNQHLKLEITIHPAGEWLLDNLYIIEEAVKQIKNELTLKKYTNFVGIANGEYKGFARIYVLASEIVAYTDNKIEKENLEEYLKSYQSKKELSMDEIWNIGIFLQIAIIQNIRKVCEKIAASQIEKYKVENIAERLIENKNKNDLIYKNNISLKNKKIIFQDMKYPFIEYMSYTLKKYGKKGIGYLNVLEETVEKLGTTVSEVIQKEHFDIAVQKVLIGNSITSIKNIQRINFLEIFEKINGVEDILKQDPAGVYPIMEYKTKEYYRNKIKEISNKTKISEIYIARKTLEICREKQEKQKETHIGYYLIDKGINELYEKLEYKTRKQIEEKTKTKIYISLILVLSVILSAILATIINSKINNIVIFILSFIIFFIPTTEITIQIIQYILSKIVKPKLIPKIDFSNGIDKENSTMVIIPTILDSKEKVKELMGKLEVYYIANKSPNIYFTLLGDCTESIKKEEDFDKEVIEEGLKQTEKLNKKYSKENENKNLKLFNFIYRKREWNDKEGSYLGWERKRGMINQFNSYILGKIPNPFLENTIERYGKENIKYIITLDADTDLILNSAEKLVGAMTHILNKPVIDEEKNIVVDGYGIMQPRIGINLDLCYKNLFTKIFAGDGGIDCYTNAISDIYQDNFKEGIFTGKGIYDLKVFEKVLEKEIPENTVLSHDLLEGCYLRCGLVSDVMLMDGYPTKYNSFMNRLSRWIRGDWQIIKWLKNKKLNLLSKYKIFDNLRRSLVEISLIISLIYLSIISAIYKTKETGIFVAVILISILPFILEFLDVLIFKKEGEEKQRTFTPKISGIKGIAIRATLTFGNLPYKAYISLKSICKTIYRVLFTHKHLLEWTTSEEAEKQAKSDLFSYYKQMFINLIFGAISLILGIYKRNIFVFLIAMIWLVTPVIMCEISKTKAKKQKIEELNKKEKEYVKEIAKNTWEYFEKYLTKENNYLITDNYQEGRFPEIIPRTSSTNIGLSLLDVVSAYDLNFIELEKCLEYIDNIMLTIDSLPKWNGHLYNWYNIKTKEPLNPKYISTVDSGNFVGYLYTLKMFLKEIKEPIINNLKEIIKNNIERIDNIINNTDFSMLYDKEHQLFSIGFNIEENKLTDSYYDLLASEARQTSLVAVAKKDVPTKHWNSLSRTLTVLGKYKGLISWSGTAFEYLMPNINIPKYEGSLLDESCDFMIMNQIEYARKLNIPWGMSEAAFNLKDLQGNYQYKAFGLPW